MHAIDDLLNGIGNLVDLIAVIGSVKVLVRIVVRFQRPVDPCA